VYNDYAEYQLEKLTGKNSITTMNHREKWLELMQKHNLDELNPCVWPYDVRNRIGRFLIDSVIFKACRIDRKLLSQTSRPIASNKQFEYAFHNIYRLTGVYKDSQIKVHPLLMKLFDATLIFEAALMPMIVPPMPWYSKNNGGYFLSKSKLIRLPESMSAQLKTGILN
jgi:DNA-directed RNA polymerase